MDNQDIEYFTTEYKYDSDCEPECLQLSEDEENLRDDNISRANDIQKELNR